MATELDKFVISLAFDVNKLQESTAKVSNTITKMIGGIDKSFKTLMSTFAVGFSLNMAKNLVEGFAKVGSGLEFASESLRVNVAQLNAWQEMAKRVGGTAEGMTSAFSNMQNAIIGADFTGGNPVVMALQQMGIATKDSKGNMRDLVSIFADINKAFQKFTPDQQLKMSKILGVDPATQRLLSLSTLKFKEQMSEVERAGLITKAQAEEATRAKVRWDNLNQTWDRIKFNLGEKLYPIFEKITTWVLKFAQNDLPKLIDKLSAFKNSIGLSNDVLIKLGVGFTVFAGVATIIGGITLAVGALSTALTQVVATLAALSGYGIGSKLNDMITKWNVDKNDPAGILTPSAKTRLGGSSQSKSFTDLHSWLNSSTTGVNKGIGFVQNLKNTWQQAIDWVTGAQAQKESGNNPDAVGDKGKSFGTFQMQKGTAKDILGYEPTSNQLKDPAFNKMLRDKYMALGMEKSGGDIKGALAFYNGGYKGLDYWKRTGKTLNNYGEDILSNSINSARLNPRASTSNKTSNTTVSIGNVAMHGVQDPKGMYDNLNSYIPVVHDSGRFA
jgi:hypothetical protein